MSESVTALLIYVDLGATFSVKSWRLKLS